MFPSNVQCSMMIWIRSWALHTHMKKKNWENMQMKCYLLVTLVQWERDVFTGFPFVFIFFFRFLSFFLLRFQFKPFLTICAHVYLWWCFICNIVFNVQWVPFCNLHVRVCIEYRVVSIIKGKYSKSYKYFWMKWLKYVKMW